MRRAASCLCVAAASNAAAFAAAFSSVGVSKTGSPLNRRKYAVTMDASCLCEPPRSDGAVRVLVSRCFSSSAVDSGGAPASSGSVVRMIFVKHSDSSGSVVHMIFGKHRL